MVGGIQVLVLAGLVAAGVLTPVSTVALLVLTRRFEIEIASASLSTDLLCLLLAMLIVTSAGARLSVDAVLRRQRGPIGALIRLVYRVIGVPSATGLRAILLLFFVALGLINLGGVVHHWSDDAWREGQVMEVILSSTYMSRVWPAWRSFETYWPEAAAWTSWFMTMTQLVMQTSMLALVWWRPTARLVVLWGCAFFLGSIVALQLHYLGAFELLIWIALFHRPRFRVAQTSNSFARPRWAEALIVRTATAFLMVFVLHETWALAGIRPYPFPQLREYIAIIGVHSPRVFNRNDQSLGDSWSVVYFGNREELLPYHGPSGERMAWTLWNDLLLYRNSIRWRGEFDHGDCPRPQRPSRLTPLGSHSLRSSSTRHRYERVRCRLLHLSIVGRRPSSSGAVPVPLRREYLVSVLGQGSQGALRRGDGRHAVRELVLRPCRSRSSRIVGTPLDARLHEFDTDDDGIHNQGLAHRSKQGCRARHHRPIAIHLRDDRGVAADAGRRQHHAFHGSLRAHASRRPWPDDRSCRAARSQCVIGIRYDATEILNGVTEVLCYGTAVVIEGADHGSQP